MAEVNAQTRTLAILVTAKRGRNRLHWTDVFTYVYLLFGVLLMFGPTRSFLPWALQPLPT